ncbi:hypothetical protein B0H14DRAFT_3063226 [Mycena olivaceomarginata]|nr:hypothetical protein B0H14DRAFT_3063226 [Mycena olivaceomarginata]
MLWETFFEIVRSLMSSSLSTSVTRLKRRYRINPDFLLLSAGMQWEIKEPTAPVRSPRPLFKPVAQISTISLLPAEQTTPLPTHLNAESLHSETEEKRAFMSKFFGGSMEDEPKRAQELTVLSTHEEIDAVDVPATGNLQRRDKGVSVYEMGAFRQQWGFEYDPSTSRSSVRFDPPDPKDVSITFHKRTCCPHSPILAPTIHPIMLREFAKKLKRNYGWSEADLLPLSN